MEMKLTLVFLATAASIAVGTVTREASNTCTSEYQKLTKSTYCATDSPHYVSGSAGISAADKQKIVDRHNYWRSRVSPTATDMMKIYWDDELAKGAEKWARQCYFGHEHQLGMTRKVPKYGRGAGQNLAVQSGTWEATVDGWQSEVDLYKYGQDPAVYIGGEDAWMDVAHYTQIVLKGAVYVGCGYAECVNAKYSSFYVCNYIFSQSGKDIITPYTSGTSCAACPDKCNDKLCDCQGKWCFNGGTLDKTTCTCKCRTLWQGDTCLDKNCPSTPDPAFLCNKQWFPSQCSIPVVQDKCPQMCGIC